MNLYHKIICPDCNSIIEDWNLGFRSVGSPISTCSQCGTLVKNEKRNEWLLYSFKEKVLVLLTLLYTSAAYGTLSMLLIILLTNLGFEQIFWLDDSPTDEAVFIVVISTMLAFCIRCTNLLIDVNQSIKRMQDKNYIGLLEKTGTIRNSART